MKSWIVHVRRILPWLIAAGGIAAALYLVVLRPTDVRSHAVSVGTVLVEALGTGSVESRRTMAVSVEVTGRLVEIHVDQGDRVEQGQPLAAIDDRSFLAEVALAEQEMELAKATLHRLGADTQRARAVSKGAEAHLGRVGPLVDRGAASAEALDTAVERRAVAAAELARAQAAQLEGQAAVSAALHRLERTRAELDRTLVRSPFDGTVIRREREVGDVAVPGATVLRLAASDTVWASVWVDETYLASLAVGLPARVVLRSRTDRDLRGTVARIGREVDRETRELLVDVSFDTPPEKLVFGQRVDLWIELARRSDVLSMPSGSVVRVQGREGAFVAEGGRARFWSLEFGLRGRERVEVTGGLSRGDVVLDPSDRKGKPLADGARVRLLDSGDAEPEPHA